MQSDRPAPIITVKEIQVAEKPSYNELAATVNELKESLASYWSFAQNTSDLLYRTDNEGKITFLSRSVYELSGYTMEEALGLNMAEDVYLIPEECDQFLSLLERNGKVRNFITRLKRKDGSIWWASTSAHFFHNQDGEICGVEGIARDITELKTAEERLSAQAQRIKVFFNALNDAVFVHPIREKGFASFVEVNSIACNRYGYSYKEFLQLSAQDITQQQDSATHGSRSRRKKLLEKGGLVFEAVHIKKSGEKFPVEINSNIIYEDGKPHILSVVRDITERKYMEAQFRKIKQLEAIATLSGGIAHEFNNALNIVSGNIELLQMALPDHADVKTFGQQAMASIQRLQKLTNKLHAYARGGKYREKDINLNDIVKNTLPIFSSKLYPDIIVDTDLSDDISGIKADTDQLGTVLSNVLENASEALEGAGRIHIRTCEEEVDGAFAAVHPGISPGDYVVLTVKDNGKGMDEETKNRIFDPFFTTKFQGRGLGMAAVYGIIKNHDGYIYVDSEPGNGTTVCILLPPIKK